MLQANNGSIKPHTETGFILSFFFLQSLRDSKLALVNFSEDKRFYI